MDWEKLNERREARDLLREQRRCTICAAKTNHYHHFADGHSTCCKCASRTKRPRRVKVGKRG